MGRSSRAAVVAVVVLVTMMGLPLAPAPTPDAAQILWGTIGNHLVTLDRSTGAATDVGTTPQVANLEGLAYDPGRGAMYGIADGTTDPKLVRIDRRTGAAFAIGPIDLVSPALDVRLAEALAFNGKDGRLYAAVSETAVPTASFRLAIVDPVTGRATQVAPFSGLVEADAMVFVDGALYVSDTQPPRTFLYRVDPATAAGALVGEVGYNHVADLAYDADTGTLFGTAHTDRLLLTISLQTGAGTVVGATHGGQDFGGATLTAITVAPAPQTSPCTITMTQGATSYDVLPVERSPSVAAFYDYFSASAHTPFVEPYASVLFLYREAGVNSLYFVFHFNIDDGGTPDATTTLTLQGVPPGAGVVLSDDPTQGGRPEFSLALNPQGFFRYFLNTDGGVLGPLSPTTPWNLSATFAHTGPDPMRTQKWVDGDTTRLPLAMVGPVSIRNVCNRAPVPNAGGPYAGLEGSPITFDASASSDPDGDPLTYTWDFENDGTDDVTTTNPTVAHTYPDDFFGLAKLTVSDGRETASTTVAVAVANVAPTLVLDGMTSPIPEGGEAEVRVRVTDPGADTVIVVIDWGDGTPQESLGSAFRPTDVLFTARRTWGDDAVFDLRVVATDDDGGAGVLTPVARVQNVAPAVDLVSVSRAGGFTLRVAGEKWHDVSATIFQDGTELATLRVVRMPGSPDDQAASTGVFDLALASTFTARVVYTPEDDPVNGQPNGANPVWILMGAPGEEPVRVHHTFNVNHPDRWVWDVDLTPHLARLGVHLAATATDPGSDDLTFAWDFGDGGTAAATYFNDGVGPDPAPSPGGTFPFSAADAVRHAFAGPGTYVVTVTVTDDDGGRTVATLTLRIGG